MCFHWYNLGLAGGGNQNQANGIAGTFFVVHAAFDKLCKVSVVFAGEVVLLENTAQALQKRLVTETEFHTKAGNQHHSHSNTMTMGDSVIGHLFDCVSQCMTVV